MQEFVLEFELFDEEFLFLEFDFFSFMESVKENLAVFSPSLLAVSVLLLVPASSLKETLVLLSVRVFLFLEGDDDDDDDDGDGGGAVLLLEYAAVRTTKLDITCNNKNIIIIVIIIIIIVMMIPHP